MQTHYLDKFQLGSSIPKWLPSNTQYLTITGSYSYGMSNDLSDTDIAGFCIPPQGYIFPHTLNLIPGFDEIPKFEEWQKHHVDYKDKNYDFKIYSIIRLFNLLINGNPNSIDLLYTDRDCVVFSTPIGELLRQNRELFISKLMVPRFRGYAYSELKNVENLKTGQRKELVKKFGFDPKNCAHIIRLLLECEQILTTGTLDLRRDKELLKHIRAGNWSLQKVKEYFTSKELYLNKIEQESKIPNIPDKNKIKKLLLEIIESHYGKISGLSVKNSDEIVSQIRILVGL